MGSSNKAINPDGRKRFIATLYVSGVTERVSEILKPYNINLLSKNSNSLRNKVCTIKDVRSSEEKKTNVYKTGCNK